MLTHLFMPLVIYQSFISTSLSLPLVCFVDEVCAHKHRKLNLVISHKETSTLGFKTESRTGIWGSLTGLCYPAKEHAGFTFASFSVLHLQMFTLSL